MGEGHNPYSLSLVGREYIASSQHAPLSIKPHCGQVTEDDVKSIGSKPWGVFHEDETRSHFANDASELGPQTRSVSTQTCFFSSNGNVLARESASDDVDFSSPGVPVEGLDVVPDREER
jgi:hypothetical protein